MVVDYLDRNAFWPSRVEATGRTPWSPTPRVTRTPDPSRMENRVPSWRALVVNPRIPAVNRLAPAPNRRVRGPNRRTPALARRLRWPVASVAAAAALGMAATPAAAACPPRSGHTFTAAVVRGVQIYACTQQADGAYAYTQHNVRASLQRRIRHSFVAPNAGPPQWIAPDHSAVTGTVVTRTPNGAGNIPELVLTATQSGTSRGLLSRVTEIHRLNTVGGVAPAGTCDPAATPTVEVPYRADYVFIAG